MLSYKFSILFKDHLHSLYENMSVTNTIESHIVYFMLFSSNSDVIPYKINPIFRASLLFSCYFFRYKHNTIRYMYYALHLKIKICQFRNLFFAILCPIQFSPKKYVMILNIPLYITAL